MALGLQPPPRSLAPVDPKKAKTVYVGNVQHDVGENELRRFFNEEIEKVPNREDTGVPPVENITINREKMYCFLELSSASDADIALCLDGIRFKDYQLRVRYNYFEFLLAFIKILQTCCAFANSKPKSNFTGPQVDTVVICF
jgi:RNA recognition motif-containing protein